MNVYFLHDNVDYLAVLDVMLQLRPSYTQESLSAQIARQQDDGYQVVYVKSAERILAVAGFWVDEKLAWGKHIYIDDLVTNSECRSAGVGGFLMAWFKKHAAEQACDEIHLD